MGKLSVAHQWRTTWWKIEFGESHQPIRRMRGGKMANNANTNFSCNHSHVSLCVCIYSHSSITIFIAVLSAS